MSCNALGRNDGRRDAEERGKRLYNASPDRKNVLLEDYRDVPPRRNEVADHRALIIGCLVTFFSFLLYPTVNLPYRTVEKDSRHLALKTANSTSHYASRLPTFDRPLEYTANEKVLR